MSDERSITGIEAYQNQSPEDLDLAIQALEMQIAQEEKQNPLQTYVPNAKVEEAVIAVGNGKHKVYLFSAANGVGKCLPLDAPVLMADGTWKKLGEIRIGDSVMAHDYDGDGIARPARVTNTSLAGMKQVYKVTFKDGGYVIASEEHHFPIKLRSGRQSAIRKRPLSSLFGRKTKWTGGKAKFQQPTLIDYGKHEPLPIHPYLFGYLLGNGCMGQTKKISFSSNDQPAIDRLVGILRDDDFDVRKYGKYDYNIVDRRRTGRNNVNRLLRRVEALNMRVGSGEKYIPLLYMTASPEDRRQLLAGLIDSDGCNREYMSKSEQLAIDFCSLVRSLGGQAIKKTRRLKTNFTKGEIKTYYRVYWAFDYQLPISCPRKQLEVKRPIEYTNRFVETIEPMGMVECGDITIDHPKHCFISYDFISTSNSAAAVAILGNIVYGAQNKWFKGTLYEKWPYPKTFWYISRQSNLKENIVGTMDGETNTLFAKWLPKKRFTLAKSGYDYFSKFQSDTEWSGTMKTFDMGKEMFEGPTIGLIVLDEPPPEYIFESCIARTREGGIIIMPMTPLSDSAWVFDRLVEKADNQVGNIFMMYADIEDACQTHGIRGHLKHEYITEMMQLWSEEEIEARAHGRPTHLKGRVYKLLNSQQHRHDVQPFEFNQKDYRIFNVVDPHDARPPFVGWFAVDQWKNAWAIEEFPSQPEFKPFEDIGSNWNLTTGEVCQRIKQIEKQYDWDPRKIIRVMDPNFGMKKDHDTGKRTYQIWAGHGKNIEWPLNYKTNVLDALEAGHDVVREYIKPNPDGQVRFKVGMNCENIWRHLNRYAYAWREGRSAEKHGAGERVAEKYKDGSDVVRYFFMFLRGPQIVSDENQTPMPEHYGLYGAAPNTQEVSDWRDPNSL